MVNEITTQDGGMNVFITGATSAVGRATVRQFIAAGHTVYGATEGSSADARMVRADGAIPVYPDLLRAGEVRSAIETANADVVINLAPQFANHAHSSAQWDARQIALITQGTQSIMEAATAAGVRFVVHTSYIFAGGHDESADSLIDAVRTGEQLVLGCSTPGCVLRFGFIYGTEQPELSALRATMKMGRAISGGDASAHSAWLHSDDAARAVVLAAQKQPNRAVIDITDDMAASSLDFLTYFADSQGLTRPSAGARFSLSGLLFGTKKLDIGRIHVEPNRAEARSVLDWTPRFSDYRQGIDNMLLTWRAEGVAKS